MISGCVQRCSSDSTGPLAQNIERNGFIAPIRVLSSVQAEKYRKRVEDELLARWSDPTEESGYTFQTHLLF